MRYQSAFLYFLLFMVGLLSTFAVEFRSELFQDPPIIESWILLSFAVLFLGITLTRIRLLRASICWALALAVTLGGYSALHRAEAHLKQSRWQEMSQIQDFVAIRGHCGNRVGHLILRALNRIPLGQVREECLEVEIQDHCRIQHLKAIYPTGKFKCAPGLDEVTCFSRWMAALGERGAWSIETREYFYQAMLGLYQGNPKPEILVDYVVRDQTLLGLSLSIPVRAGWERLTSAVTLDLDQKDKIQNQKLSKMIFERVSDLIGDEGRTTKPEPYHFKFRTAYQEFLDQTRGN